jgi:hypothetical protein
MGWTIYQEAVSDPREELDRVYNGGANRVLASATVGREYYAAVEFTGDDGTCAVWAGVALFETRPFGYKDMGEGMGPCERRCPRGILELLTPLDPAKAGYAEEWRADCWRNLGGNDRTRQLAELKAAAPLRSCKAQDDVDGLALFDQVRQPALF